MHWANNKVGYLILLLVALAVSGCAGTARGKKESVLRHDQNLSVVDSSRSKADAMVVIRYPAIVDDDAVEAYFAAFEAHAIGASFESDGQTRRDSWNIAQSIIAKSNYYTMSLYRELQDALPPTTVLLSPHLVMLDENNQLTSRPLLASEEIPSVITVDFNVYSHPDPRKMMDSEPLTFGDIVTPLFVVHSNRWLRPSTYGLLLSSSPLLDSAWEQAKHQAEEQVRIRFEGSDDNFRRPLDFVNFLQTGSQRYPDIPLKSVGEARREVIAVEQYPVEKIWMDGQIVAELANNHEIDPFAVDFAKGAATRIEIALNRVDHDRATFFTRQRALARFDQDLADSFLAQSTDPNVRARLMMAERLIEAERKFLAAQTASLYEGTYSEGYGDQSRQMIAAEYRLLEQRRELARAQNLSTALAILAMAGGVYLGTDSSSNFFSSSTMSNLLILSSLWAMNSAMAASAESRTIGENFLLQMAPAINRQVSVQLEWHETREQITANDFADFRRQTMSLYQSSIRSIQHRYDQECAFLHPALETPGRWLGGCFGGRASGTGYGLVVDSDGTTVEYLGSADSGLASGTGAMIFSASNEPGAIYYEGDFDDGWPDGVVWLEEPGRKPAVRLFRAGKDRGSADPEQLQRLVF
jgi:hypothetical protein